MLPEDKSSKSPLEEIAVERFKGHTFINEGLVTVGVTRVTVLPANPSRLFWSIINESVNDIRVSSDPTITSTSGWLLASSGGVIVSSWQDDGEGVGYTLYGICSVAGSIIRVREVIRL